MDDLKTLIQAASLNELLELETFLTSEIDQRRAVEIKEARQKIMEIARTYGLNVEDVLAKPASARKPVEAKYRHPDNADLTWTGRGRPPVWVVELEAEGRKREEFKI